MSLIKIGIPLLAGLSAVHGLVPPHPGPLAAISALGANLGITLAFGVIVAIPAISSVRPLNESAYSVTVCDTDARNASSSVRLSANWLK